ncbi:hypothetical protein HanRHA438_Chr14g0656801 [Helianthus annuus]|nr:hypothetical protein HanOQP8_Chr14g0533551 [Helianthus annuus]KAJ0853927.1 hypothetical protein HanRHA438_Chr14g0656801 [Helianthus annuus]
MLPPKGMNKWKTKFFYVKAVTITAKLQFRNVTGTIITENISIPKVETMDWFPRLRIIGWFKLDNRQLWVLQMMIGRLDRKARPVLREKNDDGLAVEAPFWRMFCPDFEGKIDIVRCGVGEEGWNRTIISNFWMPDEAALKACCRGQRTSWSRGGPAATGVPKETALKFGDKRQRKKKTHEAVSVPPLVPEAASILRTHLRKYEDYVVCLTPLRVWVFQVLLRVRVDRLRALNLLMIRNRMQLPLLQVGKRLLRLGKPGRLWSKAKACGLNWQGSCGSASNSTGVLIELDYYYRSYAEERSFDFHRPPWNVFQGDDVLNDPSACREILRGLGTPVETARARGLSRQNLQGQLASMLVGSSIIANAIMEDYNVLARREEETIRLRVEAEAMVKAAREGVEQLEREKAAFEKLKQTERWAASTGLEQVRTLAKLLSDECKLWKESYARENEKLFRVHQELNNLKAVNAALVKEKAAAEAVAKEAETRGVTALKEAEARVAKVLVDADADADHTKLNKVVEELKAELQSRVTTLEEVSSRTTEAEAWALQAEEVRDGLTTSLGLVTEGHEWMRLHSIGHIVETILDAPENATTVAEIYERARQAGFKAGYKKCLSDVNPFITGRFTDERSGFHGVDTEAAYDAAVDAYNKLSIPALDDIEKCLGAEDYVDRLRMLFDPPEEEEGTGGATDDAGTSGVKADYVGPACLILLSFDVNVGETM